MVPMSTSFSSRHPLAKLMGFIDGGYLRNEFEKKLVKMKLTFKN